MTTDKIRLYIVVWCICLFITRRSNDVTYSFGERETTNGAFEISQADDMQCMKTHRIPNSDMGLYSGIKCINQKWADYNFIDKHFSITCRINHSEILMATNCRWDRGKCVYLLCLLFGRALHTVQWRQLICSDELPC